MFTVRMCLSKQSLKNNVATTVSLNTIYNDLPAFDLPSLITVLRVIDVYTSFLKPHPF